MGLFDLKFQVTVHHEERQGKDSKKAPEGRTAGGTAQHHLTQRNSPHTQKCGRSLGGCCFLSDLKAYAQLAFSHSSE